jgi:hypothetical protein
MEMALRFTVTGEGGFDVDAGSVNKVSERTQRILAAQAKSPSMAIGIHVLHEKSAIVVLKHTSSEFILPVFTSLAFAKDYRSGSPHLRHSQVGHMTLANLARYVAINKSHGMVGTVFNKCPRCPRFVHLPADSCVDVTQLGRMLALTLATRQVVVENNLARALGELDLLKQRFVLENIRDHVDPGVPRVIYELGVNAVHLGADALFEEAIEVLSGLAPDWVDRLRAVKTAQRQSEKSLELIDVSAGASKRSMHHPGRRD